jgi:exopolyphosphatase/guanosine-5'-triphosphate,3'-diphosphate pyrophosphatase
VRNAALPGWRAEEVELIAALVRYHRKSLPKPTHPEWADATPEVRAKIEGLAGILRVADGLDRRHLGIVSGLAVEIDEAGIRLALEATQDIAPEIDAALFKAELFERAFGGPLRLEAMPAPGYASGSFDSEPSAAEIDAASLSG